MRSLRRARYAADAILTIAFAPACASCRCVLEAPLDGPVCAACWGGIRKLARDDDALPGPIAGWCASGEFEGPLRDIIHAFKYDGRRSLAIPLARLMREAGAALLADADLVVPVPLHPWRRLRRGFNQADDLARLLEVPVSRALWRTRATRPQAELDPVERRRNVRRAFRLSPLIGPSRLVGRRIVLVDDVQTTGATLDACARTLKAAGAGDIRALTVARAALHHRSRSPRGRQLADL